MIPFFEHAAWYSESMRFLSMPTDSLGEFSSVRPELISPVARSDPSVFGGFRFLILLGLLVGLMLLCRLIQCSAITLAFPVLGSRDDDRQ
jgi:hypothetical protein